MDPTGSSPPERRGLLELRPAAEQFVTERDGITTRHCLSFGEHYDPDRVRFGAMVALNDEHLPPGTGYSTHDHHGVEIVTWVLEGRLRHEDSTGHVETVIPGTVQHLTAGTGVAHSEVNAGEPGESLRFLQLWFALEQDRGPSYETRRIHAGADRTGWTTIASSDGPEHVARLAVPRVDVAVCRLAHGAAIEAPMPISPDAESFSYLATGTARLPDGTRLLPGDSVLSGAGVDLIGSVEEDLELIAVRLSPAATGR